MNRDLKLQPVALHEKLLQVEKAALVISSLIPSNLVLLLPFYRTKLFQEQLQTFLKIGSIGKKNFFFNTTKLSTATLIPRFIF